MQRVQSTYGACVRPPSLAALSGRRVRRAEQGPPCSPEAPDAMRHARHRRLTEGRRVHVRRGTRVRMRMHMQTHGCAGL